MHATQKKTCWCCHNVYKIQFTFFSFLICLLVYSYERFTSLHNKISNREFWLTKTSELWTFFCKQTAYTSLGWAKHYNHHYQQQLSWLIILKWKMISAVSAHLCFDGWHPRKKKKKKNGGKHLETAQIDGVMMSCRSVWAKRFIEFNHWTLIFFFFEREIGGASDIGMLYYTFYLGFFLSTFLCVSFFHPTMQNNLQNGWISAYLQWVKWQCCIVVVKWFYSLISIHKIAYEIYFVRGGRKEDAHAHTHNEGEREAMAEYNLSFWLLDKHSIFIVILFLYTLTRRSCSWNDPI